MWERSAHGGLSLVWLDLSQALLLSGSVAFGKRTPGLSVFTCIKRIRMPIPGLL